MTHHEAADFYNEILKKCPSVSGAARAMDAPTHIDTFPFDPIGSSMDDPSIPARLKHSLTNCERASVFLLWLSKALHAKT